MIKSHYPWIDWLRFLTAFSVVICHCRSGHWQSWGGMNSESKHLVSQVFFIVTRPALELVVIFFVLSGYLVGGPAIRRACAGKFDWKAYSIDRISRIYVPLIPCMLITGALSSLAGKDLVWSDFVGCLLGLQGSWCGEFAANSPLWSLGYEIWFYVLAGVVAWMIASRAKASISALLLLVIGLCVFLRLDSVFLFCWVLGVVGSLLTLRIEMKWCFVAGMVTAGVGFLMSQPTFVQVSLSTALNLEPSELIRLGSFVLAVGLMLVMPVLAALPAGRLPAVELAGGKFAAFSYTLYLSHYPLLHYWDSLRPARFDVFSVSTFTGFLLKVCGCVLFALILYVMFESHTNSVRIWMKRRFADRGV